MSVNEIHQDDIGTVFTVTVKDQLGPIDISLATTKTFIYKKPDKTKFSRPADFKTDGTDGVLQYTSVAGDIDKSGDWQLQVFIILPTGQFYSDITQFKALVNL
jgi:hypothetical protein